MIRHMGRFSRVHSTLRSFSCGLFIGMFFMVGGLLAERAGLLEHLFDLVYAANTGTIRPNNNSTTNQGTANTCGGTATQHHLCLDEVVTQPTTPSNTTNDSVDQLRNNVSFLQMGDNITDADTVTSISVWVYHKEGSANMLLDVALFDNGESVQIGTTQPLPVITTGTGGWSQAQFNSLSLTQTQLTNLRVRLQCTRASGGGSTNCRSFAMYADVTYDPVTNITVSAEGSQQDVNLGFTNQYVGGMFVFNGEVDARDITSITITETGSVDAQNDLSNVRLYYENAADCTGQTYDGTENQYDTAKTFNGSNQATFSVSSGVGASTTAQLCVYPVVDVDDTATAGETILLQITDPSTEVTGSGSAVVQPATAVAITGTTNILEEDLRQTRYHWRNDNGTNETDATSATNNTEGVAYDGFPRNQPKRLRVEVSNEGTGISDATQYVLEYGEKVTDCSAITEGNWIGVGDADDDWNEVASAVISSGNTSNIALLANGAVTDDNTFFDGVGALRSNSATSGAITLANNEFTELEYTIQATNAATDGGSYCFRVTAAGNPITYTIYPEAIIGADLTVSAFGTQTTEILIPTTGAYNGGGFSVVDNSAGSTHDINSVTIHASGTVDIQNHIDDIQLWYEYDTTGGDNYNCSDQGYGVGGTEFQYGVTDTDGFSATGTSTFTDTGVTASTTSGVCFYVVYTVTSNANDGELIEVWMQDPTQDITLGGSGSLSPAALIDINGFSTLVAEYPVQIRYHWRDDLGSETTANSVTNGNENTVFEEMSRNTTYRIRIEVSNEGGATTTAKQYSLEWGAKVSSCSEITNWIGLDDDTNDEFTMFNSGNISDGNTTNILSSSNGAVTDENNDFVGTGALRDTTATSGSITLDPTDFTELEYAIRATSNTSEGGSYCFRVTDQGTPLPQYVVYPEAKIKLGTDFAVYRNFFDMTSTSTTLFNGNQYTLQLNDPSRAFIRITNTSHTGAGPGGNSNYNADDVTVYIMNGWNIATSVTFARSDFPSSDTRVYWEVVEYIGDDGGENQFIVRDADYLQYGTDVGDLSTTTATISGIIDDADVVPFITGQWNPDAGRNDFNTVLSTAAWNSGSDSITFTRSESGGDAVRVSYAAVEFVGDNWAIHRVEHTYSSSPGPTDVSMVPPLNGTINKAFIHAQHRSGADSHQDFGHLITITGMGQLTFELASGASLTGQVSVAWVIENLQNQGDVMRVSQSGSTITAGATAPLTLPVDVNNTIDDLSTASIFTTSFSNNGTRSWPEPIIGATINNASTTQYTLWISDTSDDVKYATEVVEWPTAASKIIQNYYHLYYDNDQLTPTSTWGGLGETQPMTALTDPIATGENIRIRMTLEVTAAALPAGVDAFQLEYAEMATSSCASINETNWYELGEIGSTTALWRGYDGTPGDGTTLSSTTIAFGTVFGSYEEENDTALTPVTAFVGDFIEYDWNIQNNGAKDKSNYCFRMMYADGSPIEDHANYPIIRTVGYGPVIGDWRWFDDEISLTPSVPLDGAATNTAAANVANDNIIKLRTVVEERSGAAGTDVKFKLQFSESPTFATGVFDVVSSTTCAQTATTTAQLWCYDDGAGVDNAVIDDNTISTANACAAGSGAGCGTHNEGISTTSATFDQAALTNAEFEFTIRNNGARAGRVYYFRLYDIVNDEVVSASSSYPSLAAATAELVFTNSGLPAGTSTEGIVTDVATASTSVSFGSIPFNTEYEAGYRLTVNTNSTEGYQVFMIADRLMQNSYGETVPSVAGTNALPADWSGGCSGLTGCFGYHVGDDSLSGGSARFAPDNTYAAVSTSTFAEVAYSSVPANESHDIVYKIEVGEEQPAGDYSTDVTFIVIPVY